MGATVLFGEGLGVMAITVEEVRYIASLARLEFTEEEESVLARDMSAILDYMAKLNELDTADVATMSHVLDLTNVLRDDTVEIRITPEDALRSAPGADADFFRVPKVID